MKKKKIVQWIVADMSPEANEAVGKYLGECCDEKMISFAFENKQKRGYFVDYEAITKLSHIARRKGSGFSFTVYKKEGDKFARVPFGSHNPRSRKEEIESDVKQKIAKMQARKKIPENVANAAKDLLTITNLAVTAIGIIKKGNIYGLRVSVATLADKNLAPTDFEGVPIFEVLVTGKIRAL